MTTPGRPTASLTLAIFLTSFTAFAIPIKTGTEDFTANLDANLQFRTEGTWGGPPPTVTSGAAPSGHFDIDYFLRRASFSARGTAFKMFWYYIKLETGKFGARGNYTGSSQLQDVVLGYTPFEDFYVEAGFLKTPLTRPALDSSPHQLSLDGVSDILLYPNARSSRQNGVQVRGLFFDKRLLLRGGFYEGARASGNPPFVNPNGWPLAAGMARVNLVGYENSYTYPGIRLDGKSYLSVGIGGQYQSHSGAVLKADGTYNDFTAFAADVFADLALPANQELVATLDGYRFDYGSGASKTGDGAHFELGYRWGPICPEVNFYWFNSDTRKNSFLRLAAGLNYFIKGHLAKIVLEYQNNIANGALPDTSVEPTPWLHQILLQLQLAP